MRYLTPVMIMALLAFGCGDKKKSGGEGSGKATDPAAKPAGTEMVVLQNVPPDAAKHTCNRVSCTVTVITPEVKAAIEKMEHYQNLKIHFTKATTDEYLRTVQNLPWIRKLDLSRTKITNIAPLAKLPDLTWLEVTSLADRHIVIDLTPLAKLGNLEHVSFFGTKVKNDDAGMVGKPKMKHLNFYMSDPETISYVAAMKDLEVLDLYAGKQVRDLTPMKGLAKLHKVNLYMSEAKDFSVLATLPALEEVWLHFTNIQNLDMLAKAEKLRDVSASWCKQLTDISALKGKPVEALSIIDTPVADLSVLATLPKLKRLDARGTKVTDLSPLSKTTALRTLNIAATKVKSLAPLKGHANLMRLTLTGSQVRDLKPLAASKGITMLQAGKTKVKDISLLLGLGRLHLATLPKTVPAAQVKKLRAKFPKATINYEAEKKDKKK